VPDRIVPELQQLAVGDRVPDSEDWSVFFTVEKVEAPHALVLHSTRHVIGPIKTIDFSRAFFIHEVSPGTSRLPIRARTSYTPRQALPFVELVIGSADFVNAGAMLGGIKQRVENARAGSGEVETNEAEGRVAAGEALPTRPRREAKSR
jgi:hypothetical protein